MSQLFSLYYNSFDRTLDLDDIKIVEEVQKKHGEDVISLLINYKFGAGRALAVVETFFHGRLGDTIENPVLAADPDKYSTMERPKEVLVTTKRMNLLLKKYGFKEQVKDLLEWR